MAEREQENLINFVDESNKNIQEEVDLLLVNTKNEQDIQIKAH